MSADDKDAPRRYYWCSVHKKAEREGDDTGECLLTGPYSTEAQADAFGGGIRPAPSERVPPIAATGETPSKALLENLRSWPIGDRKNTPAADCHAAADRIDQLEAMTKNAILKDQAIDRHLAARLSSTATPMDLETAWEEAVRYTTGDCQPGILASTISKEAFIRSMASYAVRVGVEFVKAAPSLPSATRTTSDDTARLDYLSKSDLRGLLDESMAPTDDTTKEPINCPECGHGNRLNGEIVHGPSCSRRP